MTPQTEKRSYKSTLNLPKTRLAMKANLVQNEPASIKRWADQKLYEQLRKRHHPRGRYVFHDGPPYANGSIHLGHLLNKVLKDFVVRSKSMEGYDCPYIPGWDCHGLPIEHKVLQNLGPRARGLEAMQIRKRCRDEAEKYIKIQSRQIQRLMTLADYQNPYLTMDPEYEASVLEVFADMVGKGLAYRDLKPVHWSIENRTALAEAELEYFDREDTSVYVLFDVEDAAKLPASLNTPPSGDVALMIWTTTPWTLPANLAVAVAAQSRYVLARFESGGRTRCALVAEVLSGSVLQRGGAAQIETLGECTGAELAESGARYGHPFIDRAGTIVTATYVTLEDGTGLVHTAPGHGAEDYQTGRQHGLDIYCPVRGDGTFDDSVPQWLQGRSIWESNGAIIERLRDSGHLFHTQKIEHSYPHDWRGKSPVIFRATEQWFVHVDQAPEDGVASLVSSALRVTERDVVFVPEWGRNRMRGMLETRPDWCLSRQRAWGLPIPAFFNESGDVLLTAATVRAVAGRVRQHGSDHWFRAEPADLLADYDPSTDPDAPPWIDSSCTGLNKSTDIFDVWFESGSSWSAALRRMQGDFPADLYLEGSDQHRGWFQLSLLPALGTEGVSPFKAVFTHGFMVDKDGRKMSKSLGNTLDVDDLLKEFGADICRWWVSSLNTDNDIKVDHDFFKLAGEEYRKIRNTIRYLLSNLADFDPSAHQVDFTDADGASVDSWALGELAKLVARTCAAYEAFRFRRVHESLFEFCNQTMSAVYLTAVKDRLYCDPCDGRRRRRTQTAMWRIADALIRLVAPILPHTADESWRALHGDGATTIHLELWPKAQHAPVSNDWPQVMALREIWMKAIETARQDRKIDNPLDLGLRLSVASTPLAAFDPVDLADLCGISRVEFDEQEGEGPRIVDLRQEPRCERSWKRDGTVRPRSDGGMLCDRDALTLGV